MAAYQSFALQGLWSKRLEYSKNAAYRTFVGPATITKTAAPNGYGACLNATAGSSGATIRIYHVQDNKEISSRVMYLKANQYLYFCTARKYVTGSSDRAEVEIYLSAGRAKFHYASFGRY